MRQAAGAVNEKVYIAREAEWTAGNDLFETYSPPFDLEADMMFVFTTVPSGPLARHFDGVRFLRVAGVTPLILWFSRVRSLAYGPDGHREILDEAAGFGYNELNVVAMLRGRQLFIPLILATSGLTQELGRRYGMPKREAKMTFEAAETGVESSVSFGHATSTMSARLLASGRILAKAFDLTAPWWTWPARFPDGSFTRALVQRVPRAQIASVSGTLALDEPWLPEPVRLWPLGLYVPRFAMRLPDPGA